MKLVGRAAAVVVVVTTGAALAGCSSGSHTSAPQRTQASTTHEADVAQAPEATATLPACPKPAGSAPRLPRGVPADLPMPAGASIDEVSTVAGTVQVRFTVRTSFKQAAEDLLTALPVHGFTLAGGDAEADEIDVPFTRGASQFNVKLHAVTDPCSAQGRLVVRTAG